MKNKEDTYHEAEKAFRKVERDPSFSDPDGKIIRANRRFIMMDVSYLPFDILHGMDEIFGPVSKTVLFRIGKRWGETIFERYRNIGFDKMDSLRLSAAGAWYFGWGLVSFDLGKECSKARIYNCFEAESTLSNMDVNHDDSCRLFPGVMVGIYEKFIENSCSSVKETKCILRGDSYCELVLTPGVDEID